MNTSYGYSLNRANAFKPCRWLKGGGGSMPHTVSTLMLPPMCRVHPADHHMTRSVSRISLPVHTVPSVLPLQPFLSVIFRQHTLIPQFQHFLFDF